MNRNFVKKLSPRLQKSLRVYGSLLACVVIIESLLLIFLFQVNTPIPQNNTFKPTINFTTVPPYVSKVGKIGNSVLFQTSGITDCTVAQSEVDEDPEEANFITALNNFRVQNGVPALKLSESLFQSAAYHSHDMGVNDYFTHPDQNGRSAGQRIEDCGYPSPGNGENIAEGTDTETGAEAVQQFETACDNTTPGGPCTYAHKLNMLGENGEQWVVTGVARYWSASENMWVWTNDFGAVDPGDNNVATTNVVAGQSASPSPGVSGAPSISPSITITASVTPQATQSSSPTPTPTVATQSSVLTQFEVSASIVGIGDSVGDNPVPSHSSRNVEISLFSQASGNSPVAVGSGTITYDNGTFIGTIPITASFASGPYEILIQGQGDAIPLQPLSTSLIEVNAGSKVNIPPTQIITGDLNGDGKVDILDYNILINCFGNRLCSQKILADLNDDGLVDEVDVNIFLRDLALQQ